MDDTDISLASDKVDLFLDLWEAESCGALQTEPTRTGERVAQHYRPLQLSSMDGQQVSANFILHCPVVDSLTLEER